MKNKFFLYLILILFFTYFKIVSADQVLLEATEIQTLEGGNIIIGIGEAAAKTEDGIEIYADQFKYNKEKGLLIASGKAKVFNKKNNTTLRSEVIHYKEVEKNITSYGLTNININNKYFIKTKNLNYKYVEEEISSNSLTLVTDNFKNKIELEQFTYFLEKEVLRGKKIQLFDSESNDYFLEDGMVKLKEKLLIGKDIVLNLTSKGFENPDSEPRLVGKSIYFGNRKTIIKKGVFTSCKQTDDCPPWTIYSEEIIHDKKKKQINYKNAWLKIYDVPILYFPKFFHPDPSVKRQSGFLKPKFGDSRLLGTSINIPYFHVISDDSDLTFRPRIFSPEEFLLQSEYRKITKNSSSTFDFSINKSEKDSDNGRKTHFFSNSLINLDFSSFDESFINLKLEKTSNDGYLKAYSLDGGRNSIVNNTEVLESNLNFSGIKNDYSIDLSFESYETLGKVNSDRYEFVFPYYTLSKDIPINGPIIDSLDIISTGNKRIFKTNISETVQVNDFLINSQEYISSSGFENQVTALLKNVNSEGSNSSKFKKDTQSELLSIIAYDISLPLKRYEKNFTKSITPKISARYSPNKTKNIKDDLRYLTKENIFDLNRIGNSESIEGGSSITLGLEFEKLDLTQDKIFGLSAATVLRGEKNSNLATVSTLGEKKSDIIGEVFYKPFSILSLDYNYSLDSTLDTINRHSIQSKLSANNFVTTFDFYEENNVIGKKSYITSKSKYMFDENYSIQFSTRRNKQIDLTEYYNLIYEYKNDCLTASIQYNKEYYDNNDTTKPYEQLFFNLTLIPLGGTQTENLIPKN